MEAKLFKLFLWLHVSQYTVWKPTPQIQFLWGVQLDSTCEFGWTVSHYEEAENGCESSQISLLQLPLSAATVRGPVRSVKPFNQNIFVLIQWKKWHHSVTETLLKAEYIVHNTYIWVCCIHSVIIKWICFCIFCKNTQYYDFNPNYLALSSEIVFKRFTLLLNICLSQWVR